MTERIQLEESIKRLRQAREAARRSALLAAKLRGEREKKEREAGR